MSGFGSGTQLTGMLVAVTLNDPDDRKDHAELLDAGLQYEPVILHESGEVVGEVPVEGGTEPVAALCADRTVTVWLAPEEREQMRTTYRGRRFVYAPAVQGDYYGEILYQLGYTVLRTDTLTYEQDIEASPEARFPDALYGICPRIVWFSNRR